MSNKRDELFKTLSSKEDFFNKLSPSYKQIKSLFNSFHSLNLLKFNINIENFDEYAPKFQSDKFDKYLEDFNTFQNDPEKIDTLYYSVEKLKTIASNNEEHFKLLVKTINNLLTGQKTTLGSEDSSMIDKGIFDKVYYRDSTNGFLAGIIWGFTYENFGKSQHFTTLLFLIRFLFILFPTILYALGGGLWSYLAVIVFYAAGLTNEDKNLLTLSTTTQPPPQIYQLEVLKPLPIFNTINNTVENIYKALIIMNDKNYDQSMIQEMLTNNVIACNDFIEEVKNIEFLYQMPLLLDLHNRLWSDPSKSNDDFVSRLFVLSDLWNKYVETNSNQDLSIFASQLSVTTAPHSKLHEESSDVLYKSEWDFYIDVYHAAEEKENLRLLWNTNIENRFLKSGEEAKFNKKLQNEEWEQAALSYCIAKLNKNTGLMREENDRREEQRKMTEAIFEGLQEGRAKRQQSPKKDSKILSKRNLLGKICKNESCGFQNGWNDQKCRRCGRLLGL